MNLDEAMRLSEQQAAATAGRTPPPQGQPSPEKSLDDFQRANVEAAARQDGLTPPEYVDAGDDAEDLGDAEKYYKARPHEPQPATLSAEQWRQHELAEAATRRAQRAVRTQRDPGERRVRKLIHDVKQLVTSAMGTGANDPSPEWPEAA
jgi:hypothetical protein